MGESFQSGDRAGGVLSAGANPLAALERSWDRYWATLEAVLESAKAGENRDPALSTLQRHTRVLQGLHDEVA